MTARLLRRDSRLSVEPDVKFRVDVWIVVAVVALLVIGFLTVASASPAVIVQFGNDPAAYVGDLQTQFKALLIGAAGIVLILQFDYHDFRAFSLMIIPLLLGSLIAVFIFGSGEQFGGRRSLFGGSIQPAEFAKLLMIMYTSHWLSTRSNQLNSIQQGWVPFSVMVGLVCGLVVAQPDLSTAILIGAVSFALFFLAGASWRHILLSVPVIVAVLFFVISASTYAENRIEAWRTAIVDPRQADDQIKFGQIALSNGGILGKGLGNGEMKFRIQAAHNDYPFAVIGEETGFVGSMLVLSAFVLLAVRGFKAARNARDMYGYLLAMGTTCWLIFQAIINLAVLMAFMPNTGMPLPFISAGGSSMMATLLGVGILLNVSRDSATGRTLRKVER